MKRLLTYIFLCSFVYTAAAQSRNTHWEFGCYANREEIDLLHGRDEGGYVFHFWFKNFIKGRNVKPPFYVDLSIWREKDVYHPVNFNNELGENLNWQALEQMDIKNDGGQNAFEGKPHKHEYGFVHQDHLSYTRYSDSSFDVHFCDGLVKNFPIPKNPKHEVDVHVKYYVLVDIYQDPFKRKLLASTKYGRTGTFNWVYYKIEPSSSDSNKSNVVSAGSEDIDDLFDTFNE